MVCNRYESTILNNFYLELFSSDFRDYNSATQNAKTDSLFEYDNFDDWFDYLITVFIEDTDSIITKDAVLAELKKYPDFRSFMQAEYEELKELCDNEDF